ncbi:MAG TPA: hypothetical protein VNT30_09265 [Stellaceae bacterium]|nr:hypothetical protein [Stellaceae bacterium]
MAIRSFDDLSALFGGDAALGEAVGVSRTAVFNWRAAGQVPPIKWRPIALAAKERGADDVTIETVAHLIVTRRRRAA